MIDFSSTIYLWSFLGGLLLTIILVFLIKKIAFKFNIIDRPDQERKVHEKPIPLLGGLAIFISTFVLIFIFRYFNLADFSQISDKFLIGVFGASLIIMIIGLLDDKFNLKPLYQIMGPVLATLIVLLIGIKITYITNPVGDALSALIYLAPIIGIVVTFLWLMGIMYTTKFLDGLDGLASGIAIIASVIIFALSLRWDIAMSATSVWALIFAGSVFGFLIFNWYPAKIFLGEGGSVWIGFMLGVLSIISGSKIATTLLVIGIPALDVLWVIIWRLVKRQSPFSHADNKHLHFQLLNLGFSQKGAVLFLYLIALIFGSLAIFTTSLGKLISLVILILLMITLSLTTYLKRKKYVQNA